MNNQHGVELRLRPTLTPSERIAFKSLPMGTEDPSASGASTTEVAGHKFVVFLGTLEDPLVLRTVAVFEVVGRGAVQQVRAWPPELDLRKPVPTLTYEDVCALAEQSRCFGEMSHQLLDECTRLLKRQRFGKPGLLARMGE